MQVEVGGKCEPRRREKSTRSLFKPSAGPILLSPFSHSDPTSKVKLPFVFLELKCLTFNSPPVLRNTRLLQVVYEPHKRSDPPYVTSDCVETISNTRRSYLCYIYSKTLGSFTRYCSCAWRIDTAQPFSFTTCNLYR